MKTTISIPAELASRADEYAHRHGTSRSELYRAAIAEYLARRDEQAITLALDAVVDATSDEDAAWIDATTRATFARSEW